MQHSCWVSNFNASSFLSFIFYSFPIYMKVFFICWIPLCLKYPHSRVLFYRFDLFIVHRLNRGMRGNYGVINTIIARWYKSLYAFTVCLPAQLSTWVYLIFFYHLIIVQYCLKQKIWKKGRNERKKRKELWYLYTSHVMI